MQKKLTSIRVDTEPEQQPASRDRLLWILIILGVIFLLRSAQELFITLFVGLLLSYGLSAPIVWLKKWKVPPALSAGFVMIAVVAAGGAASYSLADDVVAIVDELPRAAQKFRDGLRSGAGEETVIDKIEKAADELESTANEAAGQTEVPKGVVPVQIQEKALDLEGAVLWGSVGLLSILNQLTLLLFLVYFLLASGELFRRKLVKIAGPTLSARKVTIETLNEIGGQIERFVLVQFFTSFVVAILTTLILQWVGLDRPLVWGIAAGIFNSIPYFGPLVVSVGILVVAFFQFEMVGTAIYTAALVSAITTLEGYLLTPWLMGRSLRMNGVSVFIGLLFWGWLWGVWGILLAVPMMVITKSICARVEGLKPIAELLED
jgi:predicted PurR-regulated permease PerM